MTYEGKKASEINPEASAEAIDEAKLRGVLNSLLGSQFEELLFRLDVTADISSSFAPQRKRAEELIQHMKKDEGGLHKLRSTLLEAVPHMVKRLEE